MYLKSKMCLFQFNRFLASSKTRVSGVVDESRRVSGGVSGFADCPKHDCTGQVKRPVVFD